jgi:hypothetical protein
MLEDTDPIYCYARADAIAEGTVVDITETAHEAGFRVPVALTRTVWGDCVHWGPDDNAGPVYQDEAGRLRDVIWMAARAAKANPEAERVAFKLLRVPRGSRTEQPSAVTLLLDIGPGDAGEPVVTIGFAEDF